MRQHARGRKALLGAVSACLLAAGSGALLLPARGTEPATNGRIAVSRLQAITDSGPDADLYALDPGGSGPPVELSVGPDNDTLPAWSPDGTRLAFVRVDNARGLGADSGAAITGRVMILDTRTGQVKPLTEGPLDAYPTWSPDGTRLAFTRVILHTSPADGPCPITACVPFAQVWVVDDNGHFPHPVSDPALSEGLPDWSSADRITFQSGIEIPGLRGAAIGIMNPDGGGRVLYSCPDCQFPKWNPDGTRIAFGIASGDGIGSISAADGLAFVQETTPPDSPLEMTDTFPTWSPDGTTIAFTRVCTGCRPRLLPPVIGTIWTVEAGGAGVETQRTVDTGDFAPAWQTLRARFTADPPLADFGLVFPPASGTRTLTVRNEGSAAGVIGSVATTGPFKVIAGGTCPLSPATAPLDPGGTCTVDVVFDPVVPGAVSGTLTVNGDPVALLTANGIATS